MDMLIQHNISPKGNIHRNLSIKELTKHALKQKEGILSDTGAVVVYTGRYTGRSPKDKFIIDSPQTHDKVDWGKINAPISEAHFERLYKKISKHLSEKENLYIFDGFAGADEQYKLAVRVVSEYAYQSLFIRHLLRRPTQEELQTHKPVATILCAPDCFADPKTEGTNSEVFVALDPTRMLVLIGGTKYAGEIKKSVFSLLNYFLPQKHVLPMHSSVNVGKDGDAVLFFGLSGTGKTTLSADKNRMLVGDDEHGWSEHGLFNFEGGCYAKCINLQKNQEPLIWDAIRDGALVENVVLKENGEFDFDDATHTENTRVAYPLEYIEHAALSGTAGHPKKIILLTADASGVLPPVAKLTPEGAVYHFLSGYTSKVSGTERGIIDPQPTFSAYYGAPFMPLKPQVYANLFEEFIKKYKSDIYLINTGWSGGPYGVGKRISISDTRTIVNAVIDGSIEKEQFIHNSLFNFAIPVSLSGVDNNIFSPRKLWKDTDAYDREAKKLVRLFVENFKQFENIKENIVLAGPQI